MDKFLPPKDPLQLENRLHTLQALPNERAKQLQKALDQMAGEQANEIQQIDKVRTLIKGKPMAIQLSLIKQHLQVDMGDHPLFQSAESDAERQTSIYSFLSSMKDFCKAKLEGYGLSAAHLGESIAKGKSEQKFVSDFWSWLNGKSSDADHKKTPWGRHPIRLPDVLAYEDSFIDVRYKFLKKMIHLQTFGPSNLKECWLFFKYIVRGDIGDKAGLGFLDDWDKITSEFINIADEAGNMHTISNNDAQYWPRPQQLLLEANPREKEMGDVVTAARSAVAAVSTTPETFKTQPKENSYRSTIPMITIPTTPAAPPPSTRAVVPANLPSPPIQSAVVANPAQIVESENMEVVAPSATNHPANSNDAPLAITAEATQPPEQMQQEAPPAEVPQQPEQMEQEQPKPNEEPAKVIERQQERIKELEERLKMTKNEIANIKQKTAQQVEAEVSQRLWQEGNRLFEQEKQAMEQRKQEAVEAERRRLEQEKLQEVELTKQAAVEALGKQREQLEAEHTRIMQDYAKKAEEWYTQETTKIKTELEEKQRATQAELADLEADVKELLEIHAERQKLSEEQEQRLREYEEDKARLEQEGQQLVQLYNAQMQQVEVERKQKEARIAEQETKLLQYEQQQQQIMYQNQNLQANLLEYEEKSKQQTLEIKGLEDQTKQIAAHNQDLQRQLQHAIGDTENVAKQLMYEREMSVADRQLVEANYNRALLSLQASQQQLELQRKDDNALRDAVFHKWQELLAQQAHTQTTALQEQIQYYHDAYGQLLLQQANTQERAMAMSATINRQRLALERQYESFLYFQNQFRRGLETGQIQVRGMAEGTLLGSQPETMSVEYSGPPAVSGQLIHQQPTSSQPNVVVKPGTRRSVYPTIEDAN